MATVEDRTDDSPAAEATERFGQRPPDGTPDDAGPESVGVVPWSYTVHPDTEARSEEEVRSYLEEHGTAVQGPEVPKPILKAEETGLPIEVLCKAKEAFGDPGPWSAFGLPVVLGGRHLCLLGDVPLVEQAMTFVPHFVTHCLDNRKAGIVGPHALVIANSCKDVRDMYEYFRDVGRSLGVETLEISEETSNRRTDFESEFHVAVGTVGSLQQVQSGKYFSFGNVGRVVVCRVDRLLDDGHAPLLRRLVSVTHRNAQLVATSRTWPPDVAGFVEELLRDLPEAQSGPVPREPVVVRGGAVDESPLPAGLQIHFCVLSDESKKKTELLDLVEKIRRDDGDAKTVVVVKTRRKVKNVKKWTDCKTFPSVGLTGGSGRKSSGRESSGRESDVQDFKSGKSKLAVVVPSTLRDLGPQAVRRVVVYDFPGSTHEFARLLRRCKSVLDAEEAHIFVTHFVAGRAHEVLDFLAAAGHEPDPELVKLAKWAADAREGRGPPLPTNKLGHHGEEEDKDDDDDSDDDGDDRHRRRTTHHGCPGSRSGGRSRSRSRSHSPDDRSRSRKSGRRDGGSRWSSAADDRGKPRDGGFGFRGRGRGSGFGDRRGDSNGGFRGGRGTSFGDRRGDFNGGFRGGRGERAFRDGGRGFGGRRFGRDGGRSFGGRGSRFGDEGRDGYHGGGRGLNRGKGYGNGEGGRFGGEGYGRYGGGVGGYEERGHDERDGRERPSGFRDGGYDERGGRPGRESRFGDGDSQFGSGGRGLGDRGSEFADGASGPIAGGGSGREGASLYGDHRQSSQRGGYTGDRTGVQPTAGPYDWNQQQGSAAVQQSGSASYFSSYQQMPKPNLATAFGQYDATAQSQATGAYGGFPRQTGASYTTYSQCPARPGYSASEQRPARSPESGTDLNTASVQGFSASTRGFPATTRGLSTTMQGSSMSARGFSTSMQGFSTSAQGSSMSAGGFSPGYRTTVQKGMQPGAYGARGDGNDYGARYEAR